MKQGTLKDKAYKYIKDKIINCEYRPGDFLDEKVLIQEINSSRTPIREALNKIEQENFIKIIPKKGVLVTPISLKNILDIYQVRELIEPNALLIYGHTFDKTKLMEFRKLFSDETLNSIDFYEIDDEFHAYVIEIYKNHYISDLMEVLRVQNQRLRILTDNSYDITPSRKEHISIIDNILSGDYIEASKKMKAHIELSKDRTLNVYAHK